MKVLKSILPVIKNKYLVTIVFFIVWMTCFDVKDWAFLMGRREKLSELQKSEEHYNTLIQNTKQQLYLLKTNSETIEKYARENFLMKKDNEDLFIVNSKPD
ncbi:MAG: septum formation initiator family protein [Ferruginibacter sp.]|nr:septum formation initiator family protein [Bacteroidota bacterium]MCW5917814.1 septum formation initiator family protein [Ferruginibacter sp.]